MIRSESASPIWRVRLLGALRADSESDGIERFRTRKVGLLFGYLAYYQNRSHSREELADMLWPELDMSHAKQHLRQALTSLRHHLEPPGLPHGAILEVQQSMVSLNVERLTTDVAEFQSRLKEAKSLPKLEKAIQLYRGELLPGYYEDWVLRERLLLEDLYTSALMECVRACEAEGSLEEAIRYLRTALEKDFLREDLHERLVRLYLAAGRPESAERHLENWRNHPDNPGYGGVFSELKTAVDKAQKVPQTPKAETVAVSIQEDRDQSSAKPAPTIKIPVHLTRYFGRTNELEMAHRSIVQRETRLLTLVGPAGTGKSRMSAEVGRFIADRDGWNVWFVPLADIADGFELPDAILSVMKVPNREGNLLEILADRLARGDNLVILDNLEHIVDRAAVQVDEILKTVPNVSLLVTSRQALKLDGESQIDLATLPTPSSEVVDLTELAKVPSVQLFVDRAKAVLADFQLTRHNAQAIGSICERLDGLPLALELAANLCHAFTPAQILQNLESRHDLLRRRKRDMNVRHASLRAAIDYSYQLLAPELQGFFLALGVFRGGFSIEAAEAICLDDQQDGLRMVLDLQERSLLHAEETHDEAPARFRLLETFREYAQELLTDRQGREIKERHADYFSRQSLERTLRPEDRENRNAAVRHLFETGRVHDCIQVLASYDNFAILEREVVAKLSQAKKLPVTDQVRVLVLQSNAQIYRSDFEAALRSALKAEELALKNGLKEELAASRRRLSQTLAYVGRRQESTERSLLALAAAKEDGDLQSALIAYINIGGNYWALGDFEKACEAYKEAVEVSMELFQGEIYWPLLYNYGLANMDLGRLDEGFQQASEGLRKAREKDEALGVSLCLFLISRYYLYKRNFKAALSTHYEAMIKRRPIGFLHWTYQAIFFHGRILLEMGRLREAAVLLAASWGSRRGHEREAVESVGWLRENMAEDAYEEAWAEGLAMNLDQAFSFAIQFR